MNSCWSTLSHGLTAAVALSVSATAYGASITASLDRAAFGSVRTGPDTVFDNLNSIIVAGEPIGDSSANVFQVQGRSIDTEVESPFILGEFSYLNRQTVPGTNVLSVGPRFLYSVERIEGLEGEFGFAGGFGFSLGVEPVAVEIEGGSVNGDIISISIGDGILSEFEIGDETYNLRLLGFSLDGGLDVVDTLTVTEGSDVSATLVGTFFLVPAEIVPTPSAAAAGLGLLGLAAVRRRRRA